MAYVAVSGGQEAIEESVQLLKYYRSGGTADLELESIRDKMRLLVDRVMAEAGLYAPDYAALALKQCEGSPEEAVFILRAYRSTLARNHYSHVMDSRSSRMIRRISAAFKDIPGGQILGPSYDYTHRLLDFSLSRETQEALAGWRARFEAAREESELEEFPRVSDLLRQEGLLEDIPESREAAFDITLNKLPLPAPRSARLQTLARADTGYVSGLAYSSLRGFGAVHPTVGELRTGWISVEVPYVLAEGEDIFVGEVLITEVESLVPATAKQQDGGEGLRIGIGYGCVLGRNETKAIAVSILDKALDKEGQGPVRDEEFVLLHGDCLEMNGFLSHLKLPHYVTFQSKLDQLRKNRRTGHGSELSQSAL